MAVENVLLLLAVLASAPSATKGQNSARFMMSLGVVPVESVSVCPDGYSYNAGLCYRWTDTLADTADAHADCAADGATLAFPRSADEHAYLVSLVSETVLIGITDVLNEGTWKYADGTPIGAFNKFLPEADHPNTDPTDCVVMSKDDGYMWKPSSCSQQYGYVCQKDADMTQVPQIVCPAGYIGIDGTKCYRVVTTVDSAITALAECHAEGADAVLPTSDLEHYYVKSLTQGTHWIGVTDAAPYSTEGNWVYITTGTPALGSFNRWGSIANDANLNCVTMDSSEAFQWAPTDCLEDHFCVCQKDPPDQCPPLVAPENGAVSGSSLPGGLATFSCDVGYNMNGAATTTCQADLTWSNTNTPTCDSQIPPTVCPDGYSYNAGLCYRWTDTLTYAMDAHGACAADGATLAFPRSADEHAYLVSLVSETVLIGITDVLHEGTWKYADGTPIGAFSKFLPDADHPNTATVDCVVMSKDDGYMWKPSSCSQQYGYVCQTDADMSLVPEIECPAGYIGVIGTKCYKVVTTVDSAITALGECHNEGADAVLPTSDLEHYYIKSLTQGTHWIGVTDAAPYSTEGNWVYLTTGTPALGSFNRWGSTANTEELDCVTMDSTEAFQWTPTNCLDDHSCVCQKDPPDQCPALLAPENGAVSGSSLPGGLATFSCDVGYNMNGAATTTCQADLTWSNTNTPTCHIAQCPPLSAPLNGALSPVSSPYVYQDEVEFSCDTGYNLVGLSTITCQATGYWSGAIPTCNIVQCPLVTVTLPVILSSGSPPYSYQDVVAFSCAEGYDMDGAASVTCQASGTWSDFVPTCNDIDACLANPCDAQATCTDNPAPALDATCACNAGYEGDGLGSGGTGCTDIDACLANPCDAQATCTDNPAPALDATCACNAGYEGDGLASGGTGCSDIDACLANPCDAQATCTDNPAPALDAICACNAGYEGDGLASGGTGCTDIDACLANPCDAQATCTDNPAPALDATCACNAGYEGDGLASGGTGCSDIDACLANPCDTQASCTDNPAPALDATCACNAGYEGDGLASGGTGCSDIDACLANPCDAQATCTDNPAPALDATCACNAGYEGDGLASGGTGCSDIDACLANPCDAQATCTDNPAPALDATCACNAGYEGDGLASGGTGCTLVSPDPCVPNPCRYGGTCRELTPSGYTCQCRSGYTGNNCQIGCKLKHPNFPVDQFAIYDNRCYWFSRYSDKAKYTSAASFCSSRGGRLPTVKSATKQSQLEGGIAKFGRNRNYWIGLDDRRREKVFKWSDGTTLGSYTNWRKVPSRHKYRDCVVISKVSSRAWNLINCKQIGQPFICQMDTLLV
ncbi:PREDICTED: sushi, von Willebrand factor type A, EGF and pentraxin domain-containing protein 1-like [Branchiostoma belcheri]|uniref:Sushi, von Willebrand factor type A, EGF and pentraxin domain-containing protein 1-like n=1 Tax=Branchiostoma belcheri TaxID=7741 RepID=A0A6P4Y3F7_BRABE|nr:PREDICTED: sushi, von Willebrand factor type A, EGF and pentraxin domain-containing protein 1-like [Branchiostoma belcheri]